MVCISISHTHGNWLRMFPAWHSIHIRTLAHRNLLSPAGLVSPAGHTLAHPWTQALAQPCWTYPCSSLLDILLLTQALAQPCWTYHCSAFLLDTDRLSPARHIRSALAAGNRPLLSPAGNNFTGACSALLEILLLNPIQVLAQPYWTQALAQPCWTQALTQPCWTQPCWFAQP